ncbi:guanylate kinase [Pseudanabaena sp. FACHB-2040]|uniref:guanylate kinase n=1 Tax=Pseudanabaena sp. FACHB-2040 TaxID=2692859 RepID=UPI00168A0B42|nr:guanylate kinase [Pseudanabaena sp. FACHB-2040]MBD2258921.1 guanylate kinase [Pseudanabaena sp. FACHB-2040]
MTVLYSATATLETPETSAVTGNGSINNLRLGRLIVFTGPSGVGKGTLLRALLQRHPELQLSVSATTRSPRPGEVHGQHYYFISRDEFRQMVDQGQLLEWAEFAGNFYGTPRQPVSNLIQAGHWVILEIELEGARQVRSSFPEALQLFVLPPSLSELEQRIRQRGQDAEDSIQKRLQRAQTEIEAATEFDIQIINDDFQAALNQLEQILFQD